MKEPDDSLGSKHVVSSLAKERMLYEIKLVLE
jgi:hypothetical protein